MTVQQDCLLITTCSLAAGRKFLHPRYMSLSCPWYNFAIVWAGVACYALTELSRRHFFIQLPSLSPTSFHMHRPAQANISMVTLISEPSEHDSLPLSSNPAVQTCCWMKCLCTGTDEHQLALLQACNVLLSAHIVPVLALCLVYAARCPG